MEFAGIVAGKVLKQSKTGVRTYLMVKQKSGNLAVGSRRHFLQKGMYYVPWKAGWEKRGQDKRSATFQEGKELHPKMVCLP